MSPFEHMQHSIYVSRSESFCRAMPLCGKEQEPNPPILAARRQEPLDEGQRDSCLEVWVVVHGAWSVKHHFLCSLVRKQCLMKNNVS